MRDERALVALPFPSPSMAAPQWLPEDFVNIATGSPVVFKDDEIEIHGTCTAIDGHTYTVTTAVGAVWTFSAGHIASGKLKVDERKIHLPHVEKCVSDVKNDGPYFWQRDGIQFCSVPNDKTPHWCKWHRWASSELCDLCIRGDFFT